MNNIERSIDYQKGYENGWKECMTQMLQPLIDLQKSALPKPMTLQGFKIVVDESLPKGQMKMKNSTGQEIILNVTPPGA